MELKTAAKWRPDIATWWPWLATIAVPLVVLAATSSSSVQHLSWWWSREEGSYGWLIPVISAFVIWYRSDRIRSAAGAPTWWGVPVFGLGLALWWFDGIADLQRLGVPALVAMGVGATLATLGWRASRYVAVPLAFLVFTIAPPGGLYVWLSLQLQFVSSEIGAAILQMLGISVFLDGNVIDLGTYKLQVAEACSGLRYLFPLTALAFLCAWMYRGPLWAKGIILASVVPITILTNSVRIALVGVFVEYGSIARAEGFMHLFEGWVIFLVAMLMLFALMYALARLRGDREGFGGMLDVDRLAGAHIPNVAPRQRHETSPSRCLPGPWIACVVMASLALPAYAAAENRPQKLPERPGLVTFPLEIGPWQGQLGTIEAPVEKALGATDYFLADYVRGSEQKPVNLWMTYFDDQVRSAAFHTPQQCLPGAGWEFVTLDSITAPVPNHDGEPFELQRALVTNTNRQILIYYWLEARGEQFLNARQLKYGNLWSSIVEGRSDGGLVRLITPIRPDETVDAAEARLVAFMEVAYPEIEPHLGR